MSQSRTFTITKTTTIEEIRSISEEYTRIAIEGLTSTRQMSAVPEHIHEIEVIDKDSIKFLRGMASHIHTLIVSNRMAPEALQPFGRYITNARVLADTRIPQFHPSIEIVFYDGVRGPAVVPAVKRPTVIDLVSDDEEEVLAPLPAPAMVEAPAFDPMILDEEDKKVTDVPQKVIKEIIDKKTTIQQIKNFKCSTVLLVAGSTTKFNKFPLCVKRIEFGVGIADNLVRDFPGCLTQVKLLTGIRTNAVEALNGELIKRLVLDKALLEADKPDLRVIRKAKVRVANVAITVEGDITPLFNAKFYNLGIDQVEINENTTVEAVSALARQGVRSIWLYNVKPEVVAAIPNDILEVVIGFETSRAAAEAISKEGRRIICAEGVDFKNYLDLVQDNIPAPRADEDEESELTTDLETKVLQTFAPLAVDDLEDSLEAQLATRHMPELRQMLALQLVNLSLPMPSTPEAAQVLEVLLPQPPVASQAPRMTFFSPVAPERKRSAEDQTVPDSVEPRAAKRPRVERGRSSAPDFSFNVSSSRSGSLTLSWNLDEKVEKYDSSKEKSNPKNR